MPTNQQYCASIRRETSLFANWPPNESRAIGDYGRLNGAIFQRYGQLEPHEIELLGTREGSQAGYDIAIKSDRSISGHASGEVKAPAVNGKAQLQIKFTSEEGVVFASSAVKMVEIGSLDALGRLLKQRLHEGEWEMAYAVVVQVAEAESATILLSDRAGAEMSFEVAANAPVTAELIAKLDAGASLVSSQGVTTKIVGQGPLVPLFKLAYLQPRLLGQPEIKYRDAMAMATSGQLDVHDIDDEYVLVVT